MNARGAIAWGVAVWLAGAGTLAAANAGPRVELPPMMVEESVSGVPWLYVNAGGTEFLSRCSAGTTRSLVEGWLDKLQQVRALVPEEFLGRMDPPSIFVLYSQDLQQTVSAEIQRESKVRALSRQYSRIPVPLSTATEVPAWRESIGYKARGEPGNSPRVKRESRVPL